LGNNEEVEAPPQAISTQAMTDQCAKPPASQAIQDDIYYYRYATQTSWTAAKADCEAMGAASDKPVANSALLALGTLSRRTGKKQPEVARLASEQISASLRDARGAEDIAVALDAIGNAGDTALAESVEAYTKDPSAVVRAHTAAAYRGMEREKMEPVLVDWLGKEAEPEVRRVIASSLLEKVNKEGEPASAAIVAAAALRLSTEPDMQARAALIALLGTAAKTNADAKRALIEHFKHEKVADLLVLIGQFIGAEDLR